MRKFFNKIRHRKPLSAQDIADALMRRGISRNDITSAHLAAIYRRLNKISSTPDFTSVKDILPRYPPSGDTDSYPAIGVIIETRKHPALCDVVCSFQERLQIPIQLFHGQMNLDYIMASSISELERTGKVRLVKLNAEALNARQYNALLLTELFWTHLLSRKKILIFQTDAILCGNSNYTLNDFLSFDYIGSKWNRQRPVGLLIDGGNGGLSLRDWKKSHECLVRFPPKHWIGGEDGYFAFHIDIIGGKVGRDADCARFSTQYEFLYKSLGAHQISSLDQESKLAFLQYCEEARFMSER